MILVLCSIFCIFLPHFCPFLDFGFLQHILLTPALFLHYFCLIFGFSFSAAYSAYSCLNPTLFLAYFCLISALFFEFDCLQHILLIPSLFLPYSCFNSALFFDFGFLRHILLIPALFLVYSCLISSLFLGSLVFCSIFHLFLLYCWCCRIPAIFLDFGFLQHVLFIPSFLLHYSFLVLFLPYPGFVFVCLHFASICCLFLVFWRIFSRCLSMRNLFVAFWQPTANRKSYIFIVGDYFDRLEPCSEISPVCHPWG